MEKEELGAALTALAATTGPRPSGTAPSDEELAAYIDNQLSEQRREEIQAFIARDPETYQRWVVALDAHSVMTHEEQPSATTAVKETPGLMERLARLIKQPWGVSALGSAAAAIMFVVLLAPQRQNLDDYYNEYPVTSFDSVLPGYTSKSLPFGEKPKAAEAIEYGIYKRLNKHFDPEKIKSFDISKLTNKQPEPDETITIEQIQIAQYAGELALLHHGMCQYAKGEQRSKYFEKTAAVTAKSMEQLAESGVSSLLGIEFNPEQDGEAACAYATEILKAL